jgi:hypothetical protein
VEPLAEITRFSRPSNYRLEKNRDPPRNTHSYIWTFKDFNVFPKNECGEVVKMLEDQQGQDAEKALVKKMLANLKKKP